MSFPTAKEILNNELTWARKRRERRQKESDALYESDVIAAFADYENFKKIEVEMNKKTVKENM